MKCEYRLSATETTSVISGKIISTPLTWTRGSYQCLCRAGYYSMHYPNGFNGTLMEIAWQEYRENISNYYTSVFICQPCAEGCSGCSGPDPCLAEYNWPFRYEGGNIRSHFIANCQLLLNPFTEYLYWPLL